MTVNSTKVNNNSLDSHNINNSTNNDRLHEIVSSGNNNLIDNDSEQINKKIIFMTEKEKVGKTN